MRIRLTPRRERLLLAALLPIAIMAGYFIAIGVYPFGKQTLLTVDLGQQYVDFYAYFRRTILGHPGGFFYAFNKDLGGDMIGTFAYYLMSPFNFVTLLFPEDKLDVAIVIMTLLKYGAAGLTMQLYLERHHSPKDVRLGLSTAYALSGWMLANQLNVMWLDGAVFLPLIALGVDAIVEGKRPFKYILWLTIAIISNYYIAYMICLFISGYFLYRVVSTRARFWRATGKFALASMLSAGLSCWLLLPTIFQLSLSKGTYTVNTVKARLEYNPLKLLGKLIVGSFSFDQMPSGEANIFVGSAALFGVVLFFFAKSIARREKMAATIWSLFLLASVLFEPLDLLWHGMQFPVWYPYRFSFVITFWLILLGSRGLSALKNSLHLRGLVLNFLLLLAVVLWVFTHQDDYTYLSPWFIGLSFLFGLGTLVFLGIRQKDNRGFAALFSALLILEAASNAAITLNQLAYISHHDYASYTKVLRTASKRLKSKLQPGDRVGKTVLRTKNDAMQVGFNGTDHFTSMMPPSVPKFFEHIGQSTNDGFVAYTNGTPILDSFLNLRGWISPIAPKLSSASLPLLPQRPDLNFYELAGKTDDFNLYLNPQALGVGFLASPDILNFKMDNDQPIENQQQLLNALTGDRFSNYFTQRTLSLPSIEGGSEKDRVVTKSKVAKATTVSYTFGVSNNDPVYLELSSAFTDNAASLVQDGETLPIYDTFRAPVLMNVTPRNPQHDSTLTFTLNKRALDFSTLTLAQLDRDGVAQTLDGLRKHRLRVTSFSDRSLAGAINVDTDNRVLMTTIPNAPGWAIKVDGKKVNAKTAAELFIALPLKRGKHRIALKYTPPYIGVGSLISLVSFALTLTWAMFAPIGRHGRHWSRSANH